MAWNRSTGDLQAGNLPAPHGFEQWLLKFDGVENTDKGTVFGLGQEFGRIEYAYSLMARDAGVDMAETHLLEEGGRAHFMTRRFDRPGVDGARLHMQTLGGLDGLDYNLVGTHDYASLFNRTRSLTESPADLAQVFTRVALNILAANNDDHVKNHSFLLPESGGWMLSPAYDITFADDPSNKWLAHHLMGVEGKFSDITRADLIRLGERYEVPGIKASWTGSAKPSPTGPPMPTPPDSVLADATPLRPAWPRWPGSAPDSADRPGGPLRGRVEVAGPRSASAFEQGHEPSPGRPGDAT